MSGDDPAGDDPAGEARAAVLRAIIDHVSGGTTAEGLHHLAEAYAVLVAVDPTPDPPRAPDAGVSRYAVGF